MAKVTPYQQQQLASSVVGTPGADQSGLMAANGALTNAAAIATADTTAQRQIGAVRDAIVGQAVNQTRYAINSYQNEIAQRQREAARQDKELREKAAKAVADDISTNYELNIIKRYNKLIERKDILPDSIPQELERIMVEEYDNLPEMDQNVGGLVHAKFNDFRVKYGSQAQTKARELHVVNAQKAIVNADNRRVNESVEATGGDVMKVREIIQGVNDTMDSRIEVLGPERAEETAVKTKQAIGEKFLLSAVQQAPNNMPFYLNDTAIQEVVPETVRNKYDQMAKDRVKALAVESNRAHKVELLQTINRDKQDFVRAMASDSPTSITGALHKFELQAMKLAQDKSGDEDIAKQEKEVLTWINQLRGRLDHHAMLARLAQSEANAERRHKDQMAKKAADAKEQAALEYLLTEDAARGKAKAMDAYWKVRGKGKNTVVTANGSDEEQANIRNAMDEMNRAYNAGQLGIPTKAETVKEFQEKMTYLQRKLTLSEAKRTERENQLLPQLIRQLQSWINHHEASNPDVPKNVMDKFNPTGNKAEQQKLESRWDAQFKVEKDKYRKANNLPDDYEMKPKELEILTSATAAIMLAPKAKK